MRRITACLLAFVLLMSLSPFASAETVSAAEKLADRLSLTSGLYTYRLLDDGTAEIIAYDARKGQEASLAVPAELDGVPVSSVGPSSFGADIYLMELTIPEGVTNLGDYAFQRCSNLTTVSLPRSLKDVGLNPFEGCEALRYVKLPAGDIEIAENAFAGCPQAVIDRGE